MTDIARKTAAQTELLRIAVRNNAGPLILQKHIDDGADVNAPMFNGEPVDSKAAQFTIQTWIDGMPFYKGKFPIPTAVASTSITEHVAAPSAKWSFGLGKAVQNLFGVIGKAVQNFFGINRNQVKQSDVESGLTDAHNAEPPSAKWSFDLGRVVRDMFGIVSNTNEPDAAPLKSVEEELFAAIAMEDNDTNREKVKGLIDRVDNIMWTNDGGQNALHIAAKAGNTFAIGLLLAKEPILVEQQDHTGATPLHQAINSKCDKDDKYENAISLLLNGSTPESINKQDSFGNTPLNTLVGRVAALDENAKSLIAVFKGAKSLINEFINKGSKIEIINDRTYTPKQHLDYASREHDTSNYVQVKDAIEELTLREKKLELTRELARRSSSVTMQPGARILPKFNQEPQVSSSSALQPGQAEQPQHPEPGHSTNSHKHNKPN